MGKINEFRHRLAGKVVTYYYNRQYRKAVEEADRRHAEEHTTIYVIDHFIKGRLLSTIDRKEFRFIKHAAQKTHRNMLFWSSQYSTDMLREQAWYHTPDGSESRGLSRAEIERRRLALIRAGLKKARLL